MDVLDKFFTKYSYKFPKGYPDLKDKQDILLMESILSDVLNEKFNLEEADTGDATLFEAALVQAWYNINKKEVPEGAIDPKESMKLLSQPKIVEKAESIIRSLNISGGSSAQGTGRGLNASLTPFWTSFGAINKTPKTDVILGDKKISVKVGNSQLMSGGKAESIATFYAAMEETPDLLDSPEAKAVIDTFDKFVKSGTTKSGGVGQNLKDNADEIIDDADKAHKEMKEKLQDLFNKSNDFKIAFAREAMSGYKKFGADSEASADWVLSVDESLSNGTLHSVNDDAYASKIADQIKLTVRFKSSQTTKSDLKSPENPKGKTGKYRFWSVVSLIINPSDIREEKTINGNILTSTVNKIKDIFSSGIEKIVKFLNPDKEEIDVDFNNNIDFS